MRKYKKHVSKQELCILYINYKKPDTPSFHNNEQADG